jgi:catechol 2,3-dioxygenase-like lactoylglutathione lyase family enzyme
MSGRGTLAAKDMSQMQAKFSYAIKFVADMDKAVAFYRDTFGLTLRFATPSWTEFDTGPVTLALHTATDRHPPGSAEIGFTTQNLQALYQARGANGLTFTVAPKTQGGDLLANILDCEGAEVSLVGAKT